jgi:hypothetical protein
MSVNLQSNMEMTITSDVQQVQHGTKTVINCNETPKSDNLSTVTLIPYVSWNFLSAY